jgi:hypothetical protein
MVFKLYTRDTKGGVTVAAVTACFQDGPHISGKLHACRIASIATAVTGIIVYICFIVFGTGNQNG